MEDSPSGVADGLTGVTAFPTSLSVAQSWDTRLALAVGDAIGAEMRGKGINIMLGPAVNLARVPWGGRLYEYLGEDPHLEAELVAQLVVGVQSHNISTCIKHYLGNNQEYNRNSMSADMSHRAMHELYLPAYRSAVDAGAGSFMVGVNQVNGIENSANTYTLDSLLFQELGFLGFVMTDWAGIVVQNASAAANAGTSVEMPRGYQYQYLPEFVANGSVPISVIDELVTRVLTTAIATGYMDTPFLPSENINAVVVSEAHTALARQLAEASAVLLRNQPPAGEPESLLPLDLDKLKASGRGILVLGDTNTVVGCGSGQQVPPYVISPQQGIYEYINGKNSSVRPVNCMLYPDTDFFQDGAPCRTSQNVSTCCALCTATPGCNFFTFVGNANCPNNPMPAPSGQCFLKANNAGYTPHPGLVSGQCAQLPPGPVPVLYSSGANATQVLELAASVDAVVVVVTSTGCEGADRTNLSLAYGYDELVSLAISANLRTVVVTRCGGACLMPWIDDVPAVLQQGLAGQEAGSALANILFGAVNPSGKLAHSFPRSEYDTWIQTKEQYPGIVEADGFQHASYSEELLVGYRWYDAKSLDPLFPFGHGLSYTTFAYSSLALNASTVSAGDYLSVTFNITNTGTVDGAEVAQVYLSYPPAAGEPPRVLRAFSKPFIA